MGAFWWTINGRLEYSGKVTASVTGPALLPAAADGWVLEIKMEMYSLPCRTVTDNPKLAAELWAEAFYQAKDALRRIRPVPEQLIKQAHVKDLDETLAECDKVLQLGET